MFDFLSSRELSVCAKEDFKSEKFSDSLIKYKLLLKRGDAPVDTHANLARVYAKLSLFEEAKTAFEEYLIDSPDAYIERFQLGLILLDLGQLNHAQDEWDKVLTTENNFPPALYYKALVAKQQGDESSSEFLLNQLFSCVEEDNLYYKLGQELKDSELTTDSAINVN